MHSSWPKRPITDFCIEIVDCVNRTASTVEGPTPYRMIRTTNVRDGFIDLSTTRYVDEPTYHRWTRRQVPQRGDIVLTREAPLGEVGLIRDDGLFLGQRLVSYRANPKVANNRYLLYALLGSDLQAQIQAFGSGATVAHMRVPDAKKLLVPMPPLHVQERIGSILSAYDDLIEVNRRRIALLEDMARRLFEEWFVHFRFPGHEDHAKVETEKRPLPTGWSALKVGEALEHATGGTWGADAPNDSDTEQCLVLRGTDFPGLRFGDFERIPSRFVPQRVLKSRTLRSNDIVLEVSGGSKDQPVGRAIFISDPLLRTVGEPLSFASFCRLMRVNVERLSPYQMFWHLDHMYRTRTIETYQSQSTGLRNFKFTVFSEKETLSVPASNVRSRFDDAVAPIMQQLGTLSCHIRHLRHSRDLLLPRLVSGEFSVSTAERELEAVA